MQVLIHKSRIELVQGDITHQDTDAIVNAANSSLLGGGGVDGAIHRAGGPQILAECRKIGDCPTGEARITSGGHLRARHVIHAVGPVYHGRGKDAELLADAYRNSLALASQHGLKSIAFPAISAGAYGYPMREAASIALSTVKVYLEQHRDIEVVRFVLFGEHAFRVFETVLKQMIV